MMGRTAAKPGVLANRNEISRITAGALEPIIFISFFNPKSVPRRGELLRIRIFDTRKEALAAAAEANADRNRDGRLAEAAILRRAEEAGAHYIGTASAERKRDLVSRRIHRLLPLDRGLADEITEECLSDFGLLLKARLASGLGYEKEKFFSGLAESKCLAWRNNFGCAGNVGNVVLAYREPGGALRR